MGEAIPKDSAVYIRYLDHVLFKNTPKAIEDAAERETIGWLTQETDNLLCIQHDRTVESLQNSSGSASGLVLLKSCIIEIRKLPLQKPSRWTLIYRKTDINNAESALQNAKRKIQPQC
jgi:hypothetical protein